MKKIIALLLTLLFCVTSSVCVFAEGETTGEPAATSDDFVISKIILATANLFVVEFSEPVMTIPEDFAASQNGIRFFWGWIHTPELNTADGIDETNQDSWITDNTTQLEGLTISAIDSTHWLVNTHTDLWPNDYFWGFYNNPGDSRSGHYGVGLKELGSRTADGYIDSVKNADGTKTLKAAEYPTMEYENDYDSISDDIECAFCTNVEYNANIIVELAAANDTTEEVTTAPVATTASDDTSSPAESTSADTTAPTTDAPKGESNNTWVWITIAAVAVVAVVVVIVAVTKKKAK